jgi:hypothetical protein
MLASLVSLAAAHSDLVPHVHEGASPLGLALVAAWALAAVVWWRGASVV